MTLTCPLNVTDTSNVLLWNKEGQGVVHVGAYPSSKKLTRILNAGVDVFVNLCTAKELATRDDYEKYLNIKVLHLPFKKKSVPDIKQLYNAAMYIVQLINKGKKIYIHSVEGAGRVNVLAAFILGLVTGITDPNMLIETVRERFATRKLTRNNKFIESALQYQMIYKYQTCT